MEQKYIPIIDEGHGGMKNGVYTSGLKKMYKFPDGLTIYEGVTNRAISVKLKKLLRDAGLAFVEEYQLSQDDVALRKRVEMINNIHKSNRRTFVLSIHSNAISPGIKGEGSKARGNEIWTSIGQTSSDVIADIFALTYREHFSNMKFRQDMQDGDFDKESQFYILKKTTCPAILVENGFHDNRTHAEYLLSEEGQWEYARCLYKGVERLNSLNPLKR